MSENILVTDDEKEITDLDFAILDIMFPDVDGFYMCGKIREKMNEPAKNPKFIKTVWGVGYTIEK